MRPRLVQDNHRSIARNDVINSGVQLQVQGGSVTGGHAFVDESKVKDYLLVSAVFPEGRLGSARAVIRGLLLPGQPRLHMKHESNARRRKILTAIRELEPKVRIYRAAADGRTEVVRRVQCLHRLVNDLHHDGHRQLCIEQDETLQRLDNQTLIEAARVAGSGTWLTYRHERARHEPLLAIPDAVAWAWPKGGDWRQRCRPLVEGVIEV